MLIIYVLRLTREEYESYLTKFSYYLLTEKPEESLQILSVGFAGVEKDEFYYCSK